MPAKAGIRELWYAIYVGLRCANPTYSFDYG